MRLEAIAAMVASLATTATPIPPGRMVDVGGHRLHLRCAGRAGPTVVIEGGFDEFSTDWALVQEPLAATVRVCAYDRAGYAWSEPGPFPRTFDQIALELRDALRKAGERPPFILVGHSFGGGPVRQYARTYAEEVVGMVLVDVVSERQRIRMGDRVAYIADSAQGRAIPPPREVASARPPLPAMPPANELEPAAARLPARNQGWRRWALAQPGREASAASERDWSAEYMAVWRRTPQDGVLGSLPLLVLTRARGGYDDVPGATASDLDQERLRAQAGLARLSTAGRQVLVDSGHDMQLEAPEVVARAIKDVVATIRGRRTTSRTPP